VAVEHGLVTIQSKTNSQMIKRLFSQNISLFFTSNQGMQLTLVDFQKVKKIIWESLKQRKLKR